MTDETTQVEIPAETALPETQAAESVPAPVETEADDAGQPEAPKKEHWAHKRIDELTRNWRQEQREKQQLLEMLQQPKAEPPPPAVSQEPPTEEQFGWDPVKYNAAKVEWDRAQIRAEIVREMQAAKQAEKQAEREHKFQQGLREFAKTKPGFDPDAILHAQYYPVSAAMSEVIKDSEIGPELLYWVDTNRDQASAIYGLPYHLAAKELGRIEERLLAAKAAPPPPRPVLTKAPAPPPTVEAIESEVEKDPESMSVDEWKKWREKQLRRKR